MLYRKVMKPIFFAMNPERAHHVMIGGMSFAQHVPGMRGLTNAMYGVKSVPELQTNLWGIPFPNPVGLAAGLDKDAEGVAMFQAIGFGFIEVGTVTPRAQPGNPSPRIFRLPEYQALVNRMGFNNKGTAYMAGKLEKVRNVSIPICVNIGKNKDTANENAAADYEACIRDLYVYADLFIVNISSPNTPDLRKLQHGDELSSLLHAVMNEMKVQKLKHGGMDKPVLVKLAPDLNDDELEQMVRTIMSSGVSGIVATNTTLARDGITHQHAGETGGLSGLPLKNQSTDKIKQIFRLTQGRIPIIGSGGIFTSDDAYEKIRAGANLIEVYTGLVYEGPNINRNINDGLLKLLTRDGFTHISQAVGVDA